MKRYNWIDGYVRNAVGLALIATLLACVLPVQAQDESITTTAQYDEWTPIGSGYMARRRVPPRANLDKSQRRIETTQKKGRSKGKKRTSMALASAVPLDVIEPARELWFYTMEEGLHSVPLETLALYTDNSSRELRRKLVRGKISLLNEGRATSWYFDTDTDALIFPAERHITFYTDTNAYQFVMSGRNAAPMDSETAPAPSATGIATPFSDRLHFEEEPDFYFLMGPVAAEPEADFWFWDTLFGGYPGWDSFEQPLRIPNPAVDGYARVTINLRGASNIANGDDHLIYAELNGVAIGAGVSFDGFEAAQLVADIDQSLLDPSGDNTLRVYNVAPAGLHPMQAMDSVQVEYQRLPVASGSLRLHKPAAGVQQVSGFASSDIIVVEDPTGSARLRTDVLVEGDDVAGYVVSFDTVGGVDYLVSESGAIHSASVAPDRRSNLASPNNAAQYLVIAPRDFSVTADAIASYRAERFGQTQVAWLEDIYDEFSSGREDPAALAAFMDYARVNWDVHPRYVMLVGKGTIDHKDRMGYADSFMPIAMVSTPWSLVSSDDALLGLVGNPAVAVGRLPITNDNEGLEYLKKLQSYENSFSEGRLYGAAALIADNNDSAGPFHDNSDLLGENLSYWGFSWLEKYYHPMVAPETVREHLLQSATWEKGYVNYDGHGSTVRLGDSRENFFGSDDAAALQNTTLPIFSALTCAAGSDITPGWRSVAGALVLNPTGGAIASMSPTGLSFDVYAQVLGNAFAQSLFGGGNMIGDAVREAKVQADGDVPTFMPHIYGVLGDPAIYSR